MMMIMMMMIMMMMMMMMSVNIIRLVLSLLLLLVSSFEEKRAQRAVEARQRRKCLTVDASTVFHYCQRCPKPFRSRIALFSHESRCLLRWPAFRFRPWQKQKQNIHYCHYYHYHFHNSSASICPSEMSFGFASCCKLLCQFESVLK